MAGNNKELYLDLIERCLINTIYQDPPMGPGDLTTYQACTRIQGMDWPSRAHSMIGHYRMRNLRRAVETVLDDGIPGDLLEAGVWRGGACVLMRAVVKAYGDPPNRRVWVADSFRGLPKPDVQRYPADTGDVHHSYGQLAVDLDTVKDTFQRYGLFDDQVRFLPGWFRDTLPEAPIEQLAVLRIDADMYEATSLALECLYRKVSRGGYIIVDDYGVVPGCRKAVDDFRSEERIDTPLEIIDKTGVCWRKECH